VWFGVNSAQHCYRSGNSIRSGVEARSFISLYDISQSMQMLNLNWDNTACKDKLGVGIQISIVFMKNSLFYLLYETIMNSQCGSTSHYSDYAIRME